VSPTLRAAIEALFVATSKGRPLIICLDRCCFQPADRVQFLLFARQLGRCQACRGGLS
jgi:hypothetical protein